MTTTPESRAELRALLSAANAATGYQPVTQAWFALARAAVNALPGLLADSEALERVGETMSGDKLSIMSGWLVYEVGEHTCGGYGPESGYIHEPGCGYEPLIQLDKLEGWPTPDGSADA